MNRKGPWHRLSVRWKAFWRALDRAIVEYHRDKVARPELYLDNLNTL